MTPAPTWPFPVRVAGDVRNGGPAELSARVRGGVGVGVVDRLNISVTAFRDLVARGGVCGGTVRAVDSAARLAPGTNPQVHGDQILWRFEALAIDPLGPTVLLNLIEGAELSIAGVQLTARGPDQRPALSPDAYPLPPTAIPFQFSDLRTSRDVDVEVIFESPLETASHEPVIDAVLAWMAVGVLGGFRHSGAPPLHSIVFPDNEPRIVLDALDLSLKKVTAHDGAFDSLVAVVAWVSHVISKVESLNIM